MRPVQDARDAVVIPFPRREMASGMERLARALGRLDAACAGQREAVEAFRRNLADLKTGMEQLDRGIRRYQDRLDELGGRVRVLNTESRRLEKWAAAVLERPSA